MRQAVQSGQSFGWPWPFRICCFRTQLDRVAFDIFSRFDAS